MSERILRALMQLFAIIAKINDARSTDEEQKNDKEQIIRSFLKIEVLNSRIDQYIALFNENYAQLGVKKNTKNQPDGKRTSVNSVKVLRICHEINKELTIRQKYIVLMRIMELILDDDTCTDLEFSFLKTVAESFRIPPEDYILIFALLKNEISIESPEKNCFILSGLHHENQTHFYVQELDNPIVCVNIQKHELIFFKYTGTDDIYVNGELLDKRKAYLLGTGSSINTSKSARVYQVDLINRFCQPLTNHTFIFEATHVGYRFPSSKIGFQAFSCRVESGNLVGIMGGSGTGKSTLIDILSGAKKPNEGTVTINGINIHDHPKALAGRIGYVPQQDLLMEELTVFQNLYYSAQLCFGDATPMQIKRKVLSVLNDLNLNEIKHLKVGSPLKKIISGGQRKRLNLALELVRNPSVLFVDEPTTGLASIGSMKIMNILKELSLKGTLVFVVIHQPSSDVFKLFNQLILIDKGGLQIYDGIPTYAPTYFKRALDYANADNESCSYCGNINPEQIFETIEAKVINEYGIPTRERKYSPQKWHELFIASQKEKPNPRTLENNHLSLPEPLKRPKNTKQFWVYLKRDFLTKIASYHYLLYTLSEAPILAFVLSYFLKYYIEIDGKKEYIYYYNENIPVFLFVSILVAIFLGMTVAAEEINKDKRNLKRERFLNLSWRSYLLGKISLLALVSAAQSLLYVIVGSLALEIHGFYGTFWFVMFSISMCANLIGLNISSAFRQTKLIYIIIPVLIIPQIIFSGLIIRYDRMNPILSHPQKVPWIGNLMISRWGYEALAVEMAAENEFASTTFELRRKSSQYQWKKEYWIPQMHTLLDQPKTNTLLASEIRKEEENWSNLVCNNCIPTATNKASVDQFLGILQLQYTNNYNILLDSIEVVKKKIGATTYSQLREKYGNESLEQLVTSRDVLDKIVVDQKANTIYQLKDPIYQSTANLGFWDAPLFIYEKKIGKKEIKTYTINLLILWVFSLLLYISLRFEVLKKCITFYKYTVNRFSRKKQRKEMFKY